MQSEQDKKTVFSPETKNTLALLSKFFPAPAPNINIIDSSSTPAASDNIVNELEENAENNNMQSEEGLEENTDSNMQSEEDIVETLQSWCSLL